METTHSDLLAYILLKGSDALAAESVSQLTDRDATTSDFKAGRYFVAEGFTFGVKLDDDEPSDEDSTSDDKDTRSFARWRRISPIASASGNERLKPPFRSETEEFEITRFIDSASPILIQNCLGSKEFSKLVVVKRARTGGDSLSGFMRFEFTKVRIKSINWDNGDAVKETCRFNFDSVNVSYWRRSLLGKPQQEFKCDWRRQN